jgi:transcriptional regulator
LLGELIGARLCVLVTAGEAGLQATHLPMLWDEERQVLEGHIARANPHHQSGAGPALVIVPGPEAYVSPSFYPSKAENARVVPTWNYESAHAIGALTWIEDRDWLRENVRALVDRHESGRAEPWSLNDAPTEYVEKLLRGIVGVSVAVERIEAKQKLSQNKSAADREGVIAGLAGSDIAARMAKIQ